MKHSWVFGYGSLANRATHDYATTHAATLTGWRRTWVPSRSGHAALLSITPAAGHAIDGLISAVPDDAWSALDQRESGYDKVPVPTLTHQGPQDASILAYTVRTKGPGQPHIRLSYLDVVVQGFFHLYGEDGVARFFATTDNWAPIHNDRAAPVYSRAQILTAAEQALVDHHIADRRLTVGGAAPT
ncbi:MAG: gamma-glutamylcyclotransferase family protein [Pseudomonadota bacterium]